MPLLPTILLLVLQALPEPPADPTPPVVLRHPVTEWTFAEGTAGWAAQAHCTLAAQDGLLKIQVTEFDPYIHQPVQISGGPLLLQVRARSRTTGRLAAYWTTNRSPQRGEDKSASTAITHDGQWHDNEIRFTVDGTLTDLRIDPGDTVGMFEIASIRLVREEPHPLAIDAIHTEGPEIRFTVRNLRNVPLEFTAFGQGQTIAASGTLELRQPARLDRPLEAVTLELAAKDLPPLARTLFVYHPDASAAWITCPCGPFTLEIARDGNIARIRRDGQTVAILGPLVQCDGRLPALALVEEGPTVRFKGDGIDLSIATTGDEISVAIDSVKPCEGPAVRALGDLQGGLFAGLEYLDRGERSSTRLDVETDEYRRFVPDPLKVTMPLMSLVTDRASLAMTWDDMTLQPVFATPNGFDMAADHRMALRGKATRAKIQVSRLSLEETILWGVKQHGLPPLPAPPRTPDQQRTLCLQAFNGPLKTAEGWGHCVEPRWPRHPFADIASACWRLGGEIPALPRLVSGGGHVRNESIYFVTGRAAQWKQMSEGRAKAAIARQRSDGSFSYEGPFARGHFEDTASGICALPAVALLEHARLTGDAAARAAGLKALDRMKRFRVPRGAQVWEIPLHTPDQLASAYAVWANVRGYELTGRAEYLAEARRWALSGIPFVYLWSRYPVMLYGTPPVLGATNWKSPCWIGLPVQWVGGVYAYSLALLAPHDATMDWKHLARGILIAAQQMQFPDGPNAGLLPDSFDLRGQERRPWLINPSGVVALQRALDGQPWEFSVASAGVHRAAAPFPLVLRDGQARIQAQPGLKYQILIDGRIVDVVSRGADVVPLESLP
jgi:hypothetical protein